MGPLTSSVCKTRGLTFDRYEAFKRKQGKTETLEDFHCELTELVVKKIFKCTPCNDGGLEAEIIRDFFTANMANVENQKGLLAETKSPERALDYAVRREKGLENQINVRKQGTTGNQSGFPSLKSEPVNFVQKKRGGYKSQPQGGRSRGGMTSRNNADRPSQNKTCFKCVNAS